MERAPTASPVTDMQFVIAVLLGLGLSHAAIAEQLKITLSTVRDHMRRLAARIPGDLTMETKIVAWVRGASLDVLEGKTLRFEVMRDGSAAIRESSVPVL